MKSPHLDSDDLEAYTLGSMQGQEKDEAEEHLIVCDYCQHRVAVEDTFVNSLRAALCDSSPIIVR